MGWPPLDLDFLAAGAVAPSPTGISVDNSGLAGVTCLPAPASQCTTWENNGSAVPHEVTFNPANGSLKGKAAINTGPELTALSCATASECVSADPDGRVAEFDPAKPSTGVRSAVIESNPGTLSVSCPTATQCATFDSSGNEVTFDPHHLPVNPTLTPVDASSGQYFNGLSCPSSTRCVAVDGSAANELTFNPKAPGAAQAPSPLGTHGFAGVSCPSVSQCAAMDNSSNEVTFNPGSPAGATAHLIDTVSYASAISCPTVSRCVVGDESGNEVTFNPNAPPASPHAVKVDNAPGSNNTIDVMACPATAQCTAFDENGGEVTFDPASTGKPQVLAIPARRPFWPLHALRALSAWPATSRASRLPVLLRRRT